MDDNTRDEKLMSAGLLGLIVERYGPFAFGVALLIAVWQTIALPQIAASKIDFEQQAILVKELTEVAATFRATGEQQRQTADILKSTAETLERMAKQMTSVKYPGGS